MRNIYSKEFESEMRKISLSKTFNELLEIAIKKYKYNITKKQLKSYLSKRKIRYKDFDFARSKRTRNAGDNYPIGSERTKSDGMVQIKIAKDKWEYKQRYIYKKYYNVELTSDDYIIFLDHNRNNFDINNLMKISKHESAILSNQQLFSNSQEVTKTGVQIAKLMIKLKEVKK